MARLGDAFASSTLAQSALDWYTGTRVPEAFRDCDAGVLRRAYREAGGVWTRMEVCDDGSVIVHNQPVWV